MSPQPLPVREPETTTDPRTTRQRLARATAALRSDRGDLDIGFAAFAGLMVAVCVGCFAWAVYNAEVAHSSWAEVCSDAVNHVRVTDATCGPDNPAPERFAWVYYPDRAQAGHVGETTENARKSHPKGADLVRVPERGGLFG